MSSARIMKQVFKTAAEQTPRSICAMETTTYSDDKTSAQLGQTCMTLRPKVTRLGSTVFMACIPLCRLLPYKHERGYLATARRRHLPLRRCLGVFSH